MIGGTDRASLAPTQLHQEAVVRLLDPPEDARERTPEIEIEVGGQKDLVAEADRGLVFQRSRLPGQAEAPFGHDGRGRRG